MPSSSEKQRKFMGAELARERAGEKTKTGMSEEQLEDFASKPIEKSKKNPMSPTEFKPDVDEPEAVKVARMLEQHDKWKKKHDVKKSLTDRIDSFIEKTDEGDHIMEKSEDTKCPECGSEEVRHNPSDNSDYICHDCGAFYNKPKKIEKSLPIIGKTKHHVPSGYGYREVERNVGKCDCGNKVELLEPTNTCGKCGSDYNMSGQKLASRSQWGEETGETASDVLRAGHHISDMKKQIKPKTIAEWKKIYDDTKAEADLTPEEFAKKNSAGYTASYLKKYPYAHHYSQQGRKEAVSKPFEQQIKEHPEMIKSLTDRLNTFVEKGITQDRTEDDLSPLTPEQQQQTQQFLSYKPSSQQIEEWFKHLKPVKVKGDSMKKQDIDEQMEFFHVKPHRKPDTSGPVGEAIDFVNRGEIGGPEKPSKVTWKPPKRGWEDRKERRKKLSKSIDDFIQKKHGSFRDPDKDARSSVERHAESIRGKHDDNKTDWASFTGGPSKQRQKQNEEYLKRHPQQQQFDAQGHQKPTGEKWDRLNWGHSSNYVKMEKGKGDALWNAGQRAIKNIHAAAKKRPPSQLQVAQRRNKLANDLAYNAMQPSKSEKPFKVKDEMGYKSLTDRIDDFIEKQKKNSNITEPKYMTDEMLSGIPKSAYEKRKDKKREINDRFRNRGNQRSPFGPGA